MKTFAATGRRKCAVAQVRLISPGTGNITVNKRTIDDYFPVEVWRVNAMRPLELVEMQGNFDVAVKVTGGGVSGQTGAVSLGISRALCEYDETLREKLRTEKLLTRDPRMVERKKYGRKKARKRFQFSKR
ncbi:MAG: 30S ribosomal protein S9 [Ignavibacteria bacterium]|jgi:small subunit ribosomal protein S9|nr:30S ribosomal protein S9 [Ignavibacteria bacterium]